jgi:DNA-binding CsgD family transcriptional regulator/tetratricopeptide (TPR) repeat protein
MILERDHELAALTGALTGLECSGGRVVLVRGEAGIGKTALIQHLVQEVRGRAHVLVGACDDLLTPQPLGPFWDVAREDASVAAPLHRGERQDVVEALLALLVRRPRPTVLVLEDTQWADEATMDVVMFLGRRIGRTNGLLVLTYRDGEVDAEHPLRQVIGALPAQVLVRLDLRRLSADAVAAMVADRHVDAGQVLALTGGNPLFVTEVLASGTETVPSSVQESVLARVARLTPDDQALLRLVAVVPGGADHTLIDEVLGRQAADASACARVGLVTIGEDGVSFAHELQRRAVESSLTPKDRRELNRRVLAALSNRDEPARLAHHARQAGDAEATVAHAPEAARAAMAIGSHREAVAHFRALEPYLDRFSPTDRAVLLHDWAKEESYLDDPAALELVDWTVGAHRSAGDPVALARALTFAAGIQEVHGRPDEAEASALEAVSILESAPARAELAAALARLGWLRLMRGDDDRRGVEIADRAIAIAEATGADLTVAHALILKGAIEHSGDDRTGFALVEEGYRRAVQGGHRYMEVYALVNLAGLCGDIRDVARAADFARRARDTAARYELRSLETYAQAVYAEVLLWQGPWAQAEDAATSVLGANPHAETVAWRVLGVLQARRGRAEAAATLDRMWSLAEASGELQNVDPAAAALAEYMWLTDDRDPDRTRLLHEVADRGRRSGSVWPSGALAFWMWKLGLLPTIPQGSTQLYRQIMEGDSTAAAAFWEVRGLPYDQALALMHGDQPARIQALHILEELGATGTAHRVRALLRNDGVHVPRGRSRATRDHAAGLTARQAEVLDLLTQDLTNVEIADRLFVSHRTVENHVAAILMKFDVPSRHAAVDAAREQGLITTP